MPGLSSPRRTSRPESVTAVLNFFRITSGSSSSSTVPCGVPPVVDIFSSGSWRSMIRAPDLGIDALGHRERLAEARVEALGDVAGELEVLALVVADRDDVGLVEQDVARHQHRVVEERRPRRTPAARPSP